MRLATRFFLATSALVTVAVATLTVSADHTLRDQLVTRLEGALESDARLIAVQLPTDSNAWSDIAHRLGAMIGRRVTLIDPTGRVRGDADFPPEALPHLENNLMRPEVQQALKQGVGSYQQLSASTNERQLYVAVRGATSGIAAIRVSATLGSVDAAVWETERTILGVGILAVLGAALVAWIMGLSLSRPLVQLAGSARAIAAEGEPVFPDSRIREVGDHVRALRAMHEELQGRFAELRREREESRTLVESMTDGVIAADSAGRIGTCNAAARRMLGRTAGEAIPELGLLFLEKGSRDFVREVLAGREVDERELTVGGRVLLGTGRMLPDGGTLFVLRDVTALRRLETVRRDFVANVSHELKTPLTSIAGYAETIAAEAEAESPARHFASTILANAKRMHRLVEDLLDLSKIESGGWRPVPRVVDLSAAAREAWSPFAEAADDRGVSFELKVPASVSIAADPDALRQILSNLYDNSLRHTPRGGNITVWSAPAGDGVVLEVRDTGSGILAEHLPRIFERFYRADPARSRDQGGTGLGLAIVKHLVEAHSGRVNAESAPGKGTTIRIVLPPPPSVTQS
ncbi:MAG TPA: ATP-binding protein [Gemmatimonadales bacterium]|jgi:signal transduction histidine kinase|nr:ATP-binding protein [Gemmatimonadales bacterium]